MDVFVKLSPHSECTEFSIYEGVYSSVKAAVVEEISKIPTRTNVLVRTVGSRTFVLIVLSKAFDETDYQRLEQSFGEDPEYTAYYEWKGIASSFCLERANVK